MFQKTDGISLWLEHIIKDYYEIMLLLDYFKIILHYFTRGDNSTHDIHTVYIISEDQRLFRLLNYS